MTNSALPAAGRGNPRASGYTRNKDDFYREPAWLVDALLNAERFDGPVLDPACGTGTIPTTCLAHNIDAAGTDLVDRGWGEARQDFLLRFEPWHGDIITNPPFNLAQEFVEHALRIASGKVAIVQRLAFLEGQKRRTMFERTPLARIWVSSKRASMPPWDGNAGPEGKGGAIAYAWFVWEPGHNGPPTLGWI